MEQKMYTSRQAAGRLHVDITTIYKWCKQGVFPGAEMRLGNARIGWRIPEGDLVALEGRTRYAVAAQPLSR